MDSNELVTVYTVSNSLEAEIIKNALADEGIRCFVQSENQAGVAGLTGMEIRIQTPSEDAERARQFLVEHDKKRKQEMES